MPDERINLPNGKTLWFTPETHAYWRHNPKTGKKGKRLTGVTTITKALDIDPGRLLHWAAKTQLIGVAEAYEDGGSTAWLASAETIWARLEELDLTFEKVRDKAAKRGTNVHELAFQALALGEPVPGFDLMTAEEKGHSNAVLAFFIDHEPKAEKVEQIVYSERLGAAGRLDFKGTMGVCPDEACVCRKVVVDLGGSGVIDAKTGRFISASAHAQVGGGYPLLAQESGFGLSEWALILQTSEDGTYELIEAQAKEDDFEKAVAAYRAAGAINGRARKAREREHPRSTR